MHRLCLRIGICTVTLLSVAPLMAQQAPDATRANVRPSAPTQVTVPQVSAVTGRPVHATTIQGNALDSTSRPLVNSVVRLRDARFGRIVGTRTTDNSGLFTFEDVDPGTYIVELVGKDETVLAASELLNVSAGDTASAIVKLPFRIPPFGGLLGHSVQQAVAVAAAAAASGVLATKVTGVDASSR